MKTVEEKAKAYDGNYKTYTELINRLEDVKDVIKKQNYGIAMDILCRPYPEFQVTTHSELKESKAERIRKALSAYFAKFKPNDMWNDDFSCGDIVDWFEKQCEKKQLKDYSTLEITDIVRQALQECESFSNIRADLYAARVGATVEYLIKKQNEQKPYR